MSKKVKVAVCTVTYNSSALLKKTIEAVLNQTYPVSHIVIVDNNSSEEHKEKLKEYEKLSEKIHIIWLDKNTGGAGGFHESMKYTLEVYDPDWYWLMDDDAYPDADCLKKLLEESWHLDNIGFIAPVIYGIDNKKYQLYHARVRRGFIYKFNAISDSIDNLKDIERIDVDAFVGPLIPRAVVMDCGLPRAEYFIEGDDTDYCYRITSKYKGYLVKKTKMNHKDIVTTNGINPAGWWKQYYWYRNSILFSQYNLHGIHKVISIAHFIAFAYKSRIRMLFDKKYDGYKAFRWRILRMGIVDGLTKKGGPILLPNEYKRLLLEHEKNKE